MPAVIPGRRGRGSGEQRSRAQAKAGGVIPGRTPHSSRARRWVQRALSAVAAGMLLLGCAKSARLDREIDRVASALADAEAQGARRCAPRELAVAQSRLEFARLEREQGSVADASEHLDVAIENAQAAALLSTPERCPPPRLP